MRIIPKDLINTGIYILQSPSSDGEKNEFRVCETNKLDYKITNVNLSQAWEFWNECLVFETRSRAVKFASDLETKADWVEHGIRNIKVDFVFPTEEPARDPIPEDVDLKDKDIVLEENLESNDNEELDVLPTEGEPKEWLIWMKNPQSKDFYFHMGPCEFDGSLQIFFCPKEYFIYYGYAYDQHLEMEPIIPSYLYCEMEMTYSINNVDENTVRQDLLNLGFESNEKFNEFMDHPHEE